MTALAPPKYVTVVGGGWSVKLIDLERLPGKIIAVNDSAIHLPRCDYIVTMDRLWHENRWKQLVAMRKPTWIRVNAVKSAPVHEHKDWITLFKNDNGLTNKMSWDPDTLNGSNSGACGVNLAYHLMPEHAFIVGLDMSRGPAGPYWYPPYPWAPAGATKPGTYRSWGQLLEKYVLQFRERGIHVTVVTTHRWSKSVPLITPNEFKELQRALT